MSITNHSLAVFLINPKVRAIRACYELEENAKPSNYVTFKTLDADIKKDDFIVVPTETRHGMTVVKVVEEVVFDPDWSQPIRWIIGKVDRAGYENLVAMENNAIRQIKEAEATHRRQELAKKMLEHVNLKDLSFGPDVKTLPASPPPSPVPSSGGTV